MGFTDLGNAYDMVPIDVLWKALKHKGDRVAYSSNQGLYEGITSNVRTENIRWGHDRFFYNYRIAAKVNFKPLSFYLGLGCAYQGSVWYKF